MMRWDRARSGLMLPARGFVPPGICSMFSATHLCGFGAGGDATSGVQPLWSPTDKDADCTLSDSDRTASISTYGAVRSTIAKTSGKWYVEATSGTGATAAQWRFGVGNASMDINQAVGKDANGWAFQGNGSKRTNDTATAYGTANSGSDDLMLALNADTGSVWIGRGGTWLNSGDPAAGTNAMFTGMTGPFYLACGSAGSTREITLKEYASYLYSPPAGFTKGW